MTNSSTANNQMTYLIFSVDEMTFALPASQVQEILWLPALTEVPGLPNDVVGVFSLRGRLVPVIDLSIRAGLPSLPYALHHQVIVLESASGQVGLIAHQVEDIHTIPVRQILPLDVYTAPAAQVDLQSRLGAGMIKLANGLAYVLDPATVAEPMQIAPHTLDDSTAHRVRLATQFSHDADPASRQIWRERAQALADWQDQAEDPDQIPLAVVRLDNELFGLDLGLVWAIAQVKSITPIPCCPPHVAGNMNLRGDVLTLIDIRQKLGVGRQPSAHQGGSVKKDSKQGNEMTIVLAHAGLRVGILVDDVLDIVLLPRAQLNSVPVLSLSGALNYATGTAQYGNQIMTVLDFVRALNDGSLEVHEEI